MFSGIVEQACRVVAVESSRARSVLAIDLGPLRTRGRRIPPSPGAAPWDAAAPAPPARDPGRATNARAADVPHHAAPPPSPADPEPGPLVRVGDSVAVSGACLTVAALEGDVARFDVITETLGRTTLGRLSAGSRVNVERALRYGDRVDGHLVQGHVETTGEVAALEREPGQVRLTIRCGADFAARVLPKGSVAIDGVSLTVVAVRGDAFQVALVPHTLERTTLGALRTGDRVNLEPDMIGAWVLHAVRDRVPG